MKRRLLAIPCLILLGAGIYQFVIRDEMVAPRVGVAAPAATIGSGAEAVGVGPGGEILDWQPAPEEGALPQLPLSSPPESGRLKGPMLQQARVLGAAPATLRPYLQSSVYGESGVDVELRSGIELRFGDASRAAQKWQAAAAVLADPSITALDYVDLHAPAKPAIYGSGHLLPPAS